MQVKQFELFREDIRDLMDLTVSKMDNYLIASWRTWKEHICHLFSLRLVALVV